MMATETITIDRSKAAAEPSIEEQAIAAGIDVGNVDPNATQQTAKEPSEKILGKFETQDALIEAYKQLEKKLGQTSTDNKEGEPEIERTEPETPSTETNADETAQRQVADEATKKAGLNLNEVSERYWQNGEKLDDADYAKLETAGYPKNLVDQYIAGLTASRTLARNAVFNTVGGEENYTSMLTWAKANFSAGEVTAYNEAVNSGDQAKTLMAVNGLKARYDNTVGREPSNPIEARAGRATGGERYESMAQLMEDMANPKYHKDPAFRKGVETKLSRSDIM